MEKVCVLLIPHMLNQKNTNFLHAKWIDFKVAEKSGTITCKLSSAHNQLIKENWDYLQKKICDIYYSLFS